MLALYYLLAYVGLGVIIAWLVQNDRLRPGEPTRGLLRMERDNVTAASDTREQGGRGDRRARAPHDWNAGA